MLMFARQAEHRCATRNHSPICQLLLGAELRNLFLEGVYLPIFIANSSRSARYGNINAFSNAKFHCQILERRGSCKTFASFDNNPVFCERILPFVQQYVEY